MYPNDNPSSLLPDEHDLEEIHDDSPISPFLQKLPDRYRHPRYPLAGDQSAFIKLPCFNPGCLLGGG